jgi:hypothetical protein
MSIIAWMLKIEIPHVGMRCRTNVHIYFFFVDSMNVLNNSCMVVVILWLLGALGLCLNKVLAC